MSTGLIDRSMEVTPALEPPANDGLVILSLDHPPEATLGVLASMEEPVMKDLKLMLAGAAAQRQEAALAASAEDPYCVVEVPDAMYRPTIVGAETIATMARARRLAGRRLVQHPDDSSMRGITT